MKGLPKFLMMAVILIGFSWASFNFGKLVGKDRAERHCLRWAQELSAQWMAVTEPMIDHKLSPEFTKLKEDMQALEMASPKPENESGIHWFVDAINRLGESRQSQRDDRQ